MVQVYLGCFRKQARSRKGKQKLNPQFWLIAPAYSSFVNSAAQGSPWIPSFSGLLLTAFSDSVPLALGRKLQTYHFGERLITTVCVSVTSGSDYGAGVAP